MKKRQHSRVPSEFARIFNSFRYAFRGIKLLFHLEHNLFIQSFFALLAIFLGFFFSITSVEWMVLVIAIGLVIFAELTNTAVERIMDFVHKDYHEDVRDIKDLAAGAVVFTVVISLIVGGIIFIPYSISFFFG